MIKLSSEIGVTSVESYLAISVKNLNPYNLWPNTSSNRRFLVTGILFMYKDYLLKCGYKGKDQKQPTCLLLEHWLDIS